MKRAKVGGLLENPKNKSKYVTMDCWPLIDGIEKKQNAVIMLFHAHWDHTRQKEEKDKKYQQLKVSDTLIES